MGNLVINDNLFLRQYEVEIEDDLAIIEYALQDRKIFLTKLIIPSSTKMKISRKFLLEKYLK
jgi:spore maturation protein CgeB